MLKGKNFIFTGLQPWDITIGSNAKDIATEVSKFNRVLYVNIAIDLSTLIRANKTPENIRRKNVVLRKEKALRRINENLWVLDIPFPLLPINKLPNNFIFNFVNKFNSLLCCSYIKKVIKHLGFNEHILFIDNDIYKSFYTKELLGSSFSLYYRRDNMVTDYWQRHAPRLEPLLCAKSDCVIANSQYLADAVKQYNPKSYNVGQGVDLSNYIATKSYTIPKSLESIKRPLIAYVGWLTELRIDAGLIEQLAAMRKDYSFILIGSQDDFFANHSLHKCKNVHFLGSISPQDVPMYIAAVDVCINPQLVNEITIGNYPRKIDEYLSMGKPSVATKTATMLMFESCVSLCLNADEYAIAIDKALLDNSKEKIAERIKMAKGHSWENSVNQIYKVIEDANL